MKKQNTITKEKLLKQIAKQINRDVNDVKEIYNTLENIIFNTLSSVDTDNDISIRLCEGISLDGNYIPEKTKKNNLTGEINLVKGKIKPKFNITRSYCEKLNNE